MGNFGNLSCHALPYRMHNDATNASVIRDNPPPSNQVPAVVRFSLTKTGADIHDLRINPSHQPDYQLMALVGFYLYCKMAYNEVVNDRRSPVLTDAK